MGLALLVAFAAMLATASAAAASPTGFIENRGQIDHSVFYYTPGVGASVYFTQGGVVIDLREPRSENEPAPEPPFVHKGDGSHGPEPAPRRGVAVRIDFEDANPSPRIEARGELLTKYNYFLGNEPEKWRTEVPTYAEVVYHDLWPGIDLVYRQEDGRIAYELVLTPGANPELANFHYEGARGVNSGANDSYEIETGVGSISDLRPLPGLRPGMLSLPGVQPAPDPNLLPTQTALLWSTFLGGSLDDFGPHLAVDSNNLAVVAGTTESTNFPTTTGAYDQTHNGGFDVFVAKLDATGSSLVWCTYLGGSDWDLGNEIALTNGSINKVVITGSTKSANFPTVSGAYDQTHNGDYDVFVAQLGSTGAALDYSTYLGGSGYDTCDINGLAVDASWNRIITGYTSSANFPTTSGAFQTTLGGGTDAFVVKFNEAGSTLIFSTFLGGTANDYGNDVALDGWDNPTLTGQTYSPDFPTQGNPWAYDVLFNGGSDVFVSKLNASGTALVWSTFIGGGGLSTDEAGLAIGFDYLWNPIVTGSTSFIYFPTTIGAFAENYNGGDYDGFVVKLDAQGSKVLLGTFLGGSGTDWGLDLAMEPYGNVVVVGPTTSSNFPTTPGSLPWGGQGDVFVTNLDSKFGSLRWSTYLAGSACDYGVHLALDQGRNPVVGVTTLSTDYPTTAAAYDTTHNGLNDVAVSLLDDPPLMAKLDINPPWLAKSIFEYGFECELVSIYSAGSEDLIWEITEASGESFVEGDGWSAPATLRPLGRRAEHAEGGAPSAQLPHLSLAKGEPDPRPGRSFRGSGGPDAFGYSWIDSDEPGGPTFNFRDIGPFGTTLTLNDDDYAQIDLPFVFPFYGDGKTEVRICSNGHLTFPPYETHWNNQPIPDPIAPNDLIAPFWDDLNPETGGFIQYYHDPAARQFIVQYTEVQHFGGGGNYTFQVILNQNGTILFQYANMEGEVTSATVGIEDSMGTTGLEVVFNAAYIHNNLAVLFSDAIPWLTAVPISGVLSPGETQDVEVCVDASGLTPGIYQGDLEVRSNDPDNPVVLVPIMFTVLNPDPDIEVTPSSLEFEVVQGELGWDQMVISNIGAQDLGWLTTEREGTMLLDDGGSASVHLEPSGYSAWRSFTGEAETAAGGSLRDPVHAQHLEVAKGERDPRRGPPANFGSGGPDEYGYRWIDSDEPDGPAFNWQDISAIGTQLFLLDDDFVEVELPFPFPFYSVNRVSVKIGSNGYLTFGAFGSTYENQPIPDPTVPNDLIAPFWDDLNPEDGGTIHHFYDPEGGRFIVQYTQIPGFLGSGLYTFQVILYRRGVMLFQYLDMQGELESATVGIEDPPGSTGLQVAFNAPYIHNELAVLIKDGVPWLWEDPPSGVVAAGGSQPVDIWVHAVRILEPGEHRGNLVIHSDDPQQPEVIVPITMWVIESTGVDSPSPLAPAAFVVHSSAPNPFRHSTTIRYDVPEAVRARLGVFDISGRLVRMLVNEDRVQPGQHQVTWDGRDRAGRRVGAGVYFYRLKAGRFTETGRMVLVR
jgi:hypothetical protein